MRKNQLASALAAAVVGIAGLANMSNAINVNPDGTGQILIYPYYTIEAGNDTLISVVNTANEVKAVKVRIKEGVNSRDVLDFSVYMSPFDVWTATIRTNPNGNAAEGLPVLFTTDTTCTVPDIRTNILLPQFPAAQGGHRYAEFTQLAMVPGRPASHARSGYFEMIEAGVVSNVPGFTPATWATHGANGLPGSCASLNAAWANGGVWRGLNGAAVAGFPLLSNTGISRPTGGLFGSASLINVTQGRLVTYNATAIEGVAFPDGSNGNQHQSPENIVPNVATYVSQATQFANVFVGGRLVQSRYDQRQIDAVSAVLAYTNIASEYAFTPGTNETFRSEWVVTFPTKRFYTDQQFVVGGAAPQAPFSRRTDDAVRCEEGSMVAYNREEARAPFIFFQGFGFSPGPGVNPLLCAEANVVNFENVPPGGVGTSGFQPLAASPILGARSPSLLRVGLPDGFNFGWANLSFQTLADSRAFRPSAEGDVWVGLPVVGFNVLAAQNVNADPANANIRAFYSGAFTHRGQRRCDNAAGC